MDGRFIKKIPSRQVGHHQRQQLIHRRQLLVGSRWLTGEDSRASAATTCNHQSPLGGEIQTEVITNKIINRRTKWKLK
jgi:hypothetical protein